MMAHVWAACWELTVAAPRVEMMVVEKDYKTVACSGFVKVRLMAESSAVPKVACLVVQLVIPMAVQ